MDEPLINASNNNDEKDVVVITKQDIVEEVKKQVLLAGPLICVSFLQSCLQLISVMFVGHLGELALSAASMATSFATVTGFSLLVSCLFVCLLLFCLYSGYNICFITCFKSVFYLVKAFLDQQAQTLCACA